MWLSAPGRTSLLDVELYFTKLQHSINQACFLAYLRHLVEYSSTTFGALLCVYCIRVLDNMQCNFTDEFLP